MESSASELASFLLAPTANHSSRDKKTKKALKNASRDQQPIITGAPSNAEAKKSKKNSKPKGDLFEKKPSIFFDKSDADFFDNIFGAPEESAEKPAVRITGVAFQDNSRKAQDKSRKVKDKNKKVQDKSKQVTDNKRHASDNSKEVQDNSKQVQDNNKPARNPELKAGQKPEPNAGHEPEKQIRKRFSQKIVVPEQEVSLKRSAETKKSKRSAKKKEELAPLYPEPRGRAKTPSQALEPFLEQKKAESLLLHRRKNDIKYELIHLEKSLLESVTPEEEIDEEVFTMFRDYLQKAIFEDYYKRDYDAFGKKDVNGDFAMILSKKFELLSLNQKIASAAKKLDAVIESEKSANSTRSKRVRGSAASRE